MISRLLCLFLMVAAVFIMGAAAAQNAGPSPDDLAKAVDALGEKIKLLQSGNAAVVAAVKKLDATLDPVRDKKDPDYTARLISDTAAWLKSQSGPKSKADAWAKVKDLWSVAGALRTPLEAVTADLAALNADLAAPLSDTDKVSILPKLKDLGKTLDMLVADRGRKIHIVSARYGDIKSGKTSRICEATAYFVGACEGKPNCPVANTDALNGATVCGYEPAPLAPDGTSYAEVTYKCIYFGMREYPDVTAQEASTPASIVKLHPKDKIVCNTTP